MKCLVSSGINSQRHAASILRGERELGVQRLGRGLRSAFEKYPWSRSLAPTLLHGRPPMHGGLLHEHLPLTMQ